jgi:nucleotide-binding universal stress UspA family protein
MYSLILVPIDGSTTSASAVAEAASLARLCGARVRLLHIVDMLAHTNGFERPEIYSREIRPVALQAGEELLASTRAGLEAQGIAVETELCESLGARVSQLVVERAVACGAELVVLGTHGRRGVDRMLLGSDAEQVARTSPVPVMLIRARAGALPAGA